MADTTDHYGLQKIGAGEAFSLNGYKYTKADRDLIDTLLYVGAEGHVHNGAAFTSGTSVTQPNLTLDTTTGNLPSNTTIYYRVSLVDSNGVESQASLASQVTTPAPVSSPGAPTLTLSKTGGVLLPGKYFYVLTAYNSSNTLETKALNYAYLTIPAGSNVNKVTLTLPSLPAGADGFNIYRKKPGGMAYYYLASVAMDVATPPTTYVDTGSVEEDCNRGLPTTNTTSSSNSVTISYGGATPVVPVGYTWKIYRSYLNGYWENSLVHWVVEETFETSGIITPEYIDMGYATVEGMPQDYGLTITNPQPIDLTDGGEVQGTLPIGMTAVPVVEHFEFCGTLEALTGKAIWVCEYPEATILACRAHLGDGDTAGSGGTPTGITVDVNKWNGSSFTTIYTTQANRPTISAGGTVGSVTQPNTRTLVNGDRLRVDIDSIGNSVGLDYLCVNVYMIVHGYPTDTSFVEGTTTGSGL